MIEVSPEIVEAIAQRVTELLAPRIAELLAAGQSAAPEFVDAAELAARIGKSRDYVYAHADELGALRPGRGARPRLLFPWPVPSASASAELTNRSAVETARPDRSQRHAGSQRQTGTVELLPFRGDRRRLEAA